MPTKDGRDTSTGSGTKPQSQNSQWENTASAVMDVAATLIPLIKNDSQRAQVKNRIKLECGAKPLFGQQRKREYEQCQIRVMSSIRRELVNNSDFPPTIQPTGNHKSGAPKNTALLIVGGVAIIGILTYFVVHYSKKA